VKRDLEIQHRQFYRTILYACQLQVYICKCIAKRENTKCKTGFPWTDWKRSRRVSCAKRLDSDYGRASTLLCLGFSALVENTSDASRLNKNARTMQQILSSYQARKCSRRIYPTTAFCVTSLRSIELKKWSFRFCIVIYNFLLNSKL